jgi:hypothetical protein
MPDENGVIATHYRIDSTRPQLTLAGGLRAFPVIDGRDSRQDLMAVLTRPELPARPRVTIGRAENAVPYTLLPLEYGSGRDRFGTSGWFIVCDAVPGPAISEARTRWREQELVACVLLPVAAALLALQTHGLTHRGINPDNLFRASAQQPVTLGPFWAAPPASLQPAVFEPPYMARCVPNGRGAGTVADDVYALGVTLLALASGRVPLADMDEATILRRKIELGSYVALTADAQLPQVISDLLRSMLAEDPAHRPSPKLLLNPEQARARRIAARPPRRALQALNVGGQMVFSSRELSHALGLKPDLAYPLLKTGAAEHWIRRNLGDPQLGMALEDVTRKPAEQNVPEDSRHREMIVMQSACAIDPFAPLVWRGIAVQPDGIATALATASPEVTAALEEVVAAEAVVPYLDAQVRRPELASQREEARDFRRWLGSRGPSGGLRRLIYAANPMLPCASPLLANQTVVRINDMLPALDAAAATADRSKPPMDAHIAAFIAAHADSTLTGELMALKSFAGPAERLAVLRLFGRLENRLQPGPLPGLGGWLLQSGFATLEDWRSHKLRAELEETVKQAAAAGQIAVMLQLVDDPAARRADEAGAEAAAARLRVLQAALDDITTSGARRGRIAQTLGQELATGAGLLGVLGAAVSLALR